MSQDRSLKTKILPLPRSTDDIVELLRKVLGLGFVQEIRINTSGITVQRHVPDGEEVLPDDVDPSAVDAGFLLDRLQVEPLQFDPEEHSYIRLLKAFQQVQARRRLRVVAVLAPNADIFGAFLGLEEEAPTDSVFGVPVFYLEQGALANADKFVVVGSPTVSVRDANYGLVVDMGD